MSNWIPSYPREAVDAVHAGGVRNERRADARVVACGPGAVRRRRDERVLVASLAGEILVVGRSRADRDRAVLHGGRRDRLAAVAVHVEVPVARAFGDEDALVLLEVGEHVCARRAAGACAGVIRRHRTGARATRGGARGSGARTARTGGGARRAADRSRCAADRSGAARGAARTAPRAARSGARTAPRAPRSATGAAARSAARTARSAARTARPAPGTARPAPRVAGRAAVAAIAAVSGEAGVARSTRDDHERNRDESRANATENKRGPHLYVSWHEQPPGWSGKNVQLEKRQGRLRTPLPLRAAPESYHAKPSKIAKPLTHLVSLDGSRCTVQVRARDPYSLQFYRLVTTARGPGRPAG
jgi:hypothetical protein